MTATVRGDERARRIVGGLGERLAAQPALARRPDGPVAARILGAALSAVDPVRLVRGAVSVDDDGLRLGEHRLRVRAPGVVWCIAAGKAAVPMARALGSIERLSERLGGGVVITKHADEVATVDARLRVLEGDHPVPGARSAAAGAAVLEVLDAIGPGDALLVLLSGGASSLMVAPASGLELEHLRGVGEALVRSGAAIEDVNAVRARLDRLKGGGLARLAAPAPVATLVLDDVVDAPLHVVGSGPTLPLPRGGPDPAAVLERHGIAVPPAVARRLTEPAPWPPAAGPVLRLAGNDTAVAAAMAMAQAEGWDVRRWPVLRGEARALGPRLAANVAELRPARPTAWVGGGETTVTVRGTGRGGRNQALALAAVPGLAGARKRLLITLATDGEDGPTDAAGAVIDGASQRRAQDLGLSVARHLDDDDAYPVFEALDDLLRIGSTGTNACDLVLALVRP